MSLTWRGEPTEEIMFIFPYQIILCYFETRVYQIFLFLYPQLLNSAQKHKNMNSVA